MPQTFSCPNCAAPLDYDGGTDYTITCPFCHSTVIVPEGLRESVSSFTLSNLPDIVGQSQNLAEMARLIRAGKKIEAIKLYRQIFGVGLKQAKDAVETLGRGEPLQLSNLQITTPPSIAIERAAGQVNRIGCIIAAIIGLVALSIVLPIVFTFSQITQDLQSAFAVATPTRAATLTRTPTPTSIPTPGFAMLAAKFGDKGTGPGFLNDTRSIALDGAGNIYVADYSGGRVQALDAAGKFITQWFVGNAKTIIRGLAANRKGTVYVVADGAILRYEGSTGKPLGSLPYSEGDKFDAITVAADGSVYVMWYEQQFGFITSIQGHREDLVRFDADGKMAQVFRGPVSSQSGDPELNITPAIDGLGNIYLLGGTFDTTVFKYAPDGKFVNKFGGKGDQPGQLRSADAIAIDNQGRVYVADSKGIQVFDSNGRYIEIFKSEGTISGMLFNDKNELFAVARDRVLKYVLTQR